MFNQYLLTNEVFFLINMKLFNAVSQNLLSRLLTFFLSQPTLKLQIFLIN